jgi:hypothetical protein
LRYSAPVEITIERAVISFPYTVRRRWSTSPVSSAATR